MKKQFATAALVASALMVTGCTTGQRSLGGAAVGGVGGAVIGSSVAGTGGAIAGGVGGAVIGSAVGQSL
ncbi:hypothetical protein [Aliihoeflea sp. PC F10.4]